MFDQRFDEVMSDRSRGFTAASPMFQHDDECNSRTFRGNVSRKPRMIDAVILRSSRLACDFHLFHPDCFVARSVRVVNDHFQAFANMNPASLANAQTLELDVIPTEVAAKRSPVLTSPDSPIMMVAGICRKVRSHQIPVVGDGRDHSSHLHRRDFEF